MNTIAWVLSWFSILLTVSAPLTSTQSLPESRIFLSSDLGTNWMRADTGFPPDDGINAMILHNNTVFAATNVHGVWSLDKSGWHVQSKGLPKSQRIISLLSYQQILFAGVFRKGLFYSVDEGNTWQSVRTNGLPPANGTINVRALAGRAGEIYAGTDEGIYKVDVASGEWTSVLSGIQVNAFQQDVRHLYAATQKGLLRSDNGREWESIYNGVAIHDVAVNRDHIIALDYHGNVFTSLRKDPVFVKQNLFLPGAWFQLTPGSPKILRSEAQERSIIKATPRYGLPDEVPLNILLQTPFGLLAAGPAKAGC